MKYENEVHPRCGAAGALPRDARDHFIVLKYTRKFKYNINKHDIRYHENYVCTIVISQLFIWLDTYYLKGKLD